MRFRIEVEREDDGRWIAEVPGLPGVMVYGPDRATAVAKVQALALRVMEEVALVRAIQEGEESDSVSRDEVFRSLEPRG